MAKRRQGDLRYWAKRKDLNPTPFPAITICLVTHNAIHDLPRFEAALHALDYPLSRLDFQIIDNGSTDGTQDWLKKFSEKRASAFRSVNVHYGDNIGYGPAQNIVIKAAETDLILVCNPDAMPAPDSLKIALEHAFRDPEDIAAWEFSQRPYEHPKYYDPVSLETSWNSHACVLLRRQPVLDVGGYDPNLFLYGEDVDLSFRLRRAGYRLRYVPRAKVQHDSISRSGRRDEQAFRALAANYLLRQRFGGCWDRWVARLLTQKTKGETENNVIRARKLIHHKVKAFKPVGPPKITAPFNGVYFDRRRHGAACAIPDATADLSSLGRVTIITRSHKAGPVLDQAIATVQQQTYPDIEHIIVEDGYGEDRETGRTRYISTSGLGRSAAGNMGAAAATGDWLLWLDYDDLLFADHIETLLSKLVAARHADPSIIGAYSLAWESAGRRAANTILPLTLHIPQPMPKDVGPDTLDKENPFAIQSVLFHHSLFEHHGGFDETLDLLEDWDLWRRYAQSGRFIAVPKTTSIFHTPAALWPRIRRQFQFRLASMRPPFSG